jgi:arabinogalactan endo-1,4-beta-galactosidase
VVALGVAAQKYVGGDISMLKKFVDEGAIYKDSNGDAVEPLTLFQQQGWNSMRVRLFVDPSKASAQHRKEGVIQDLEYVKALGRQIKDAGFSLMLDFHYSDTWTDPGNHSTPSAWSSLNASQLAQKVYDYTKDCLQQMVAAGASPDFIQVGNEITTGMLWPTGQISKGGETWNNLASYLREGIRACREVCPQAQVVIHTELHYIQGVYNFYAELAKYTDVQYDIIGLSYYPDHHGKLSDFNTCLSILENRYPDKKIMIVETGYGYEYSIGTKYDLSSTWPLSDAGQLKFTKDLIAVLNNHANVNGLYWWYPEYNLNGIINKGGTEDWTKDFTSGYWNAALFWPRSGWPLSTLFELKNFVGDDTGIGDLPTDNGPLTNDDAIYDLQGRRIDGSKFKVQGSKLKKGVYIMRGKKFAEK